MVDVVTTDLQGSTEVDLSTLIPPIMTKYTCARCGFEYQKLDDFEPYLCYRCLRYMAKKTWVMVHTLQPVLSRPERPED